MHVGIDLGTTFSMIGHVNAQGVAALFPDLHDASLFRTPSVVHVGPDGCLVGDSVEELLEDEPTLPIVRFAKLAMGGDPVFVDHLERAWSPEAISALILRKLQKDAEAFAYEDVASAVIAVPSQFGDAQRRATKNAGLIAGLRVARLVEEPIAAATHYGLSRQSGDSTLFVYDLGGGTFDATVLQSSPDGLFAIATEGTNDVGGKWFDERIMDLVADGFRREHGFDPRTDPAAIFQLRRFAEAAKIRLCKPGKGQVRQTLLLGGRAHEFMLTRGQFEGLIEPLIARSIEVSERCLASAALGWEDVDHLLLCGGSSLAPAVQNRVREASGLRAEQAVAQQPHQAVAYGASSLAGQGADDEASDGPGLVHQIASYDLGMRVWDRALGQPGVKSLIDRNTPLPASHTGTFYTTRADQNRLVFEFVQCRGEDADAVSLGHFAFGPIMKPRKNYPVEVTVAYDVEGLVRVTARDAATGEEMEQLLDESDDTDLTDVARQRKLVMGLRINE